MWRLGILIVALLAGPAWAAPDYQLIAHPQVSVDVVSRRFVGDVFLKKVVEWPDGVIVKPVDLDQRSPVRAQFVDNVLKRSIAAVKSYWQQMIFSGRRLPPPELDDDADVLRYVAQHPGAIGYISARAAPSGVKVLRIEDR